MGKENGWLVAASDPSFKIGDRVEISDKHHNPLMRGEAGVVTKINQYGDDFEYDVLLDDPGGVRGGYLAKVQQDMLLSAENPMRVKVKEPTAEELKTMVERIKNEPDPVRQRQLYEQYEEINSAMNNCLVSEASSAGILVGTSGFKYKHWAGTFYPKDVPGREWLKFYSTKFPTVEISSTFHNMPEPRVLKTWHSSTPDDFTFAIRAPKAVTHEAHLLGCGPLMSTFMRRLEILGDKLGPVTFQLLQSERFDADVFKAFAESLPTGFKYSMEFRSEPWYNDEAYDIMRKHNIANVIVGHSNMGIHTIQTADWSHVRMSGHHPDYKQNSYTDEQLMNWRGIVADAKRPSYVYFNNEYMAYAAHNAQKLMEIMSIKYKPSGKPMYQSPRSISPNYVATPVDNRSNGDDGYVEQHDIFEKTPPDSPADKKIQEMGYPASDW